MPINHIHTPRSSQRHFIIYVVICVSSTQRLWVESEQWPRDWCYVSMNDTSLILIQTGYIGLMSLRPINPRHYHIVFFNSMAISATQKSCLGLLGAPCRTAPDKVIDGHNWLVIRQESQLQSRRPGVNLYQFLCKVIIFTHPNLQRLRFWSML